MVDVFKKNICDCCKNTQCTHKIILEHINGKNVTYKCEEYIKDIKKIKPYIQPLVVTAKRDYVSDFER